MKKLQWIFHLMFWIIPITYILFLSDGFVVGIFSKKEGTLIIPLIYGTFLNMVLFYLSSFLVVPKYFKKGKYSQWFLITLLLFLSITLLESFIDKYAATIYYPDDSFNLLRNIFVGNAFIHIIILGLSLAYSFSINLVLEEKKKQQMKQEQLESELKMLRTQINPHFLFNTLNNLFSSARRNSDFETAQGISYLSEMMRFMLYESNEDMISLKKEVDYIDNYIQLQSLRFEATDEIDISFKKEGEYDNLKVAPLLLIPFVENAFKYGINLRKKSLIDISLFAYEKQMLFKIKNSKHSFTKSSPNGGIGIENVKKRLSLIYGEDYFKLKIDDNADLFQVFLHIKFQNSRKDM